MKIFDLIKNCQDDWVFNTLGIESFNQSSRSRLRHWFTHLKDNVHNIDGDIFEFGVYKGGGVLSMGILLKILNSTKKIYAFDSFSGFPSYHKNDSLDNFETRNDLFDHDMQHKAQLCRNLAEWRLKEAVNPSNISTSGDFSDISKAWLENRINQFELDNIVLVEGDFINSVPKFFDGYNGNIFSANIDCDLYEGYRSTLGPVYERCLPGSMIYLDEFYSLKFPGARIAVSEFFDGKNDELFKLRSFKHEFERWAIIKKSI